MCGIPEPHLGSGRFAVFHFNLQCHLVVTNKYRTRDRGCVMVCNTAARSEGSQRECMLIFPFLGLDPVNPGHRSFLSSPHTTVLGSLVLCRNTQECVGLPAGLKNMSAPITPHSHALSKFAGRWQMEGGQSKTLETEMETRWARSSGQNSSHSGYGKNMLSLPGSKKSEHFQGSGSIYFFLEPLSIFHEYTKNRNSHVLGRPQTRSPASVTY